MNRRAKNRLIFIIVLAIPLIVGWQFLRDHYHSEIRQARSELRHTLSDSFPESARNAALKFGLTPFASQPQNDVSLKTRPVVLVHGLDDPGKVWMNLAPALTQAGYRVIIFTYPDDQPIDESADFFARELAELRLAGTMEVDIVAHSMGGLVSRELLTAIRHKTPDSIPGVRKLIMVGTPNHGSEMARFRVFSEIRDQLAHLFEQGSIGWLDWVHDGAGEAGMDLTPGSPFLRELNARPAAADTDLLVIAGVLGRIDRERLQLALERYQDHLPDMARYSVEQLLDAMQSMADGVGDGLVTLDSARLEGAAMRIVQGNHLSIIRNVLESSERIPPAIPLILKELEGN